MNRFACVLIVLTVCALPCQADEAGNIRIVTAATEAINKRDLAALDAYISEHVVRHSAATAGVVVTNLAEFRAFLETDFTSIPDSVQDIEIIFGNDDFVAVRASYRGTQTGPMGPFPATGKKIVLWYMAMFRIEDGKIAEIWVEWDNLDALTQLGHLPPPGDLWEATNDSVYDPITQDPETIDIDNPPAILELNFESQGKRLNGILYMANGSGSHPTVILLHGFPGNEKNLDLAQALRRDGLNVLFFHYRGAWGSEGVYSFTHVIEDVASAIQMLRTRAAEYRVDPEHIYLIGHSLGGFAALQGAARDNSIACVAAIAPGDLGVLAQLFEADAEVAQGFATYSDSAQMLSGLTGVGAVAEITSNADVFSLQSLAPLLAGKSVLLIGADKDSVVPTELNHFPLVAAYEAEPEIDLTVRLLSGDHPFSWTRIELMREVLVWARSCHRE